MRNSLYDSGARKRTVSLGRSADLYTKTKGAKADIHQDLSALNAFLEEHGSFAEMVREHFLSEHPVGRG